MGTNMTCAKQPSGLAITLGSGGARALASLGVLSILAKNGIKPAALSGCSMGSIIAAYYGVHGETETLREWFETKNAADYFSYITGAKLSRGLLGTKRLEPLLATFLQNKEFKETRIPVRIVATNLNTARQTIFSKGPLLPPVMASIAIPGIFPTKRIGDNHFVDGAFTNPTPIDVFSVSRYAHFLALDYHLPPERVDNPNLFTAMIRAAMISTHDTFQNRTRPYLHKATIICPNDSAGAEFLRFDHARQHIRVGETAGKRLINNWKKNGVMATVTSK